MADPGEQEGRALTLAEALGKAFNPAQPLAWDFITLEAPGQPKLHVLLLHTSVGRMGFGFTDDDLSQLIRKAEEKLTGLVLPDLHRGG